MMLILKEGQYFITAGCMWFLWFSYLEYGQRGNNTGGNTGPFKLQSYRSLSNRGLMLEEGRESENLVLVCDTGFVR